MLYVCKINTNTMSNFSPNKIKFLLKQNGYGRVTDTQLAKLLNRKKHNIAMWKNKSPNLLDEIDYACGMTGLTFTQLMNLPNKELMVALGKHPFVAYQWNRKRPQIIADLFYFFGATGLTFEMIYERHL